MTLVSHGHMRSLRLWNIDSPSPCIYSWPRLVKKNIHHVTSEVHHISTYMANITLTLDRVKKGNTMITCSYIICPTLVTPSVFCKGLASPPVRNNKSALALPCLFLYVNICKCHPSFRLFCGCESQNEQLIC